MGVEGTAAKWNTHKIMDYGGRGRYSNTNAIEIVPEAFNTASNEAWSQSSNEQSIWPTKDDYQVWNTDSTPEQPSNKKPRTQPQTDSNSKSKAIGKMFFKTKLCCKFRAGTCPYITNCNFAHGMEELRPPPPNWQEIVAANEEAVEPREEHQIPILTSDAAAGEGQRSYKGRHCKKFFTEEGCPYGDMCTFLHDEQSKARESVAISLSPSFGSSNYAAGANGTNQKPSNWKTRICNKWEMTGYCPFGSKCHFAHGAAELHLYGGGLVENEGRDAASGAADSKQAATPLKANNETNVASNLSSVARQDIYHMGLASQRTTLNPRQGPRALQKWKGPDKISLIYGDWIDDFE